MKLTNPWVRALVVAATPFVALVAHAETAGWDGQNLVEVAPRSADPLPTDLGPESIDASRRAIRADIQDWSDDRDAIKTRRILACALAGAEASLFGGGVEPLLTLTVVTDLQRYLGGTSQGSGPSAPLYTPLSQLADKVPFTLAERQVLQSLMNREAPDLTDRIRLAIDTQSFLMKVSARLYQEQIDYHLKRTEGFWGVFRADPEFCAAYTLQAERDSNLILAAYRVLAFYNFLEQQLKD